MKGLAFVLGSVAVVESARAVVDAVSAVNQSVNWKYQEKAQVKLDKSKEALGKVCSTLAVLNAVLKR